MVKRKSKKDEEEKKATEEAKATEKAEATEQQDAPRQEFTIQRLYVKDVSFEAPNTPLIFNEEWKPQVELDLNSTSKTINEGLFEVVLKITVTTKVNDKVAFLVEALQAGVFTIKNFPNEQMGSMLGSYCPSILFPYIREVISDVVVRGGFPQLLLAPVNFDLLYQQHLQKQQAAQSSAEA